MSHKVAIIKTKEHYYDDYVDDIVVGITEWSTVSPDELKILQKASLESYTHGERFIVIEQPINQDEFIMKTVEDYLKAAKLKEEKAEAARKERERKKAQAAIKKRAKTEEDERRLLEELQKKYAGDLA